MTTQEIEALLILAQRRHAAALKALAPRHRGGEWAEYQAADANLLQLERALARSKGDQYADTCDFPVRWDMGAPMPHVLANDRRIFLVFYVREVDPKWDGTFVTIREPADERTQSLALVEFHRCVSFRLGDPNDEVHAGHPPAGKGLKGYTAQIVRNPEWIKALEDVNRVHTGYRPARWTKLTHYSLWFHDSTFECVAETYAVQEVQDNLPDLLTKTCQRLLS